MPDFRSRLNRAQRAQYDRSNAVGTIPVRVSPRLERAVELLRVALETADHTRTERIAQVICDEICVALRVPGLRVAVGAERPADRRGELHGLYIPAERGRLDRVNVWMRTAKRGQVVAYKTFLRTLVHEVCHHLDYTVLRLDESFHTDGFFKRESSLVHQLIARRQSAMSNEP